MFGTTAVVVLKYCKLLLLNYAVKILSYDQTSDNWTSW